MFQFQLVAVRFLDNLRKINPSRMATIITARAGKMIEIIVPSTEAINSTVETAGFASPAVEVVEIPLQ